MNTATDENERRYLMKAPQRLGFLPTRWFWTAKENRRIVGWTHALVAFATMVLADVLGVHYLIAAASLLITLPLGEGLLEKYVRHQVTKRRALAEADDAEGLNT
jgi:hypothetical protein